MPRPTWLNRRPRGPVEKVLAGKSGLLTLIVFTFGVFAASESVAPSPWAQLESKSLLVPG